MGFELNKLMRQYGLATPTMLSYEGERGPDVEVIDEETGEVIFSCNTEITTELVEEILEASVVKKSGKNVDNFIIVIFMYF